MRVVLIGAGLEENLALQYLAPPLRLAGHEVRIEPFDRPADRDGLVARLLRRPPDLVGMSVAFQHRLRDFRELSRGLRAAGLTAPIVWGGHIPTARAGTILETYPEVDVVVRHDGEETLVALTEALATAPLAPPAASGEPRRVEGELLRRLLTVEGLAFRLPEGRSGATPPRPAIRDLDALPWPDRPDVPTRHVGLGFAPIVGSRGCWNRCTYCSIQTYHRGRGGPRVRLRAPDAVAEELAALYHGRQRYRIFCFHDENFLLPRPKATIERLRALREGLERRGVGRIGVVAKCRPDQLTPEVLREAQRLGLLRVYVGIESGSQAGLDQLGRGTTVATCREALRLLRAAGVYACFNVLLFTPDTVLADVRETIAFLRDANDFPWNFCRAEVYPGSLLEERLRAEGRLRGGLEGMSYTIAHPAAELLFRLTAVAFGGRNFGPQGTANAASGLGYTAAALAHFFPGRAATAYVRQTEHLLRAFQEETLDFLARAYEFVAAQPAAARVPEFTEALAAEIAAADGRWWPAMEALRVAMDRHGAERAPALVSPPPRAGLRRVAALAAAATLAGAVAAACETSQTVDPAPSDVRTDGGLDSFVVDPAPVDAQVADPPPQDVLVADPLPPDVRDGGDVRVVDDLPRDVVVVDPPPPDVVDDVLVVDPLPQDVQVADPLPPDVQVADPLPPDVIEDAADEPDVPPPVDPLPPDVSAAAPSSARPALPLDRGFRVQLETAWRDGALHLEAQLVGAAAARLRWRAAGGTLTASGTGAVFRPEAGAASPFVMVTATAPGGRLDVARVLPERPRS